MDIPSVKHSEIQEVSIEMVAEEPALFTLLPENGAVFLSDTLKVDFMNGLLCPEDNEISLTFNLKSNLFGENSQTLSIPV